MFHKAQRNLSPWPLPAIFPGLEPLTTYVCGATYVKGDSAGQAAAQAALTADLGAAVPAEYVHEENFGGTVTLFVYCVTPKKVW